MSEVLIQIPGSGRLHRASFVNGKVRAYEGCNLDDAADPTVLSDDEAKGALANAEPGQLCRNDFPDVPANDAA